MLGGGTGPPLNMPPHIRLETRGAPGNPAHFCLQPAGNGLFGLRFEPVHGGAKAHCAFMLGLQRAEAGAPVSSRQLDMSGIGPPWTRFQ